MPRPRKDGAVARAARRRRLTELLVRRARPEKSAFNIWDLKQSGLVLRVQPSGHRAWKVVYRHHGRPRCRTGRAAARRWVTPSSISRPQRNR